MRANKSTRLRYASLPQIVGAQDPDALLFFTPKTSDIAHRASRHNAYIYIYKLQVKKIYNNIRGVFKK